MTSIFSSLWNTAESAATRAGGGGLDARRHSIDSAARDAEMREAASDAPKQMSQPALSHHAGTNVWSSVFNPGKNMSMKKTPASYYDKPVDGSTTWDQYLKGKSNQDGSLVTDELQKDLRRNSADANQMKRDADKNVGGGLEARRHSIDSAAKEAEIREAVSDAHKLSQPALSHHAGTNVWSSVFNPGKNMSMKKTPASYYDKPVDGSTTWDHYLKGKSVEAFQRMDTNRDGFVDADELRKELRCNSADINQMIKDADKNGDGKIDFAEFSAIFRNSPSA